MVTESLNKQKYNESYNFLEEQHVNNLYVLMHDILDQDEQSYINPFLLGKSTVLELRDDIFNYKIMAYAKFVDKLPISVLCISMPDIRNNKTSAEVKFFNCESCEEYEYREFIKKAILDLFETSELNKISINLDCQKKNYTAMCSVLKDVGFETEAKLRSALVNGSDVEILSIISKV